MLIEPSTMEFYGVEFLEDTKLNVTGPNGELPVKFKIQRQPQYRY